MRHVASLSPRFDWVGIYILKGQFLELGPFIGAETEHRRIRVGQGVCGTAVTKNADQNIPKVKDHAHYLACSEKTQSELVILIRDSHGEILGQIDIDSHTEAAFGESEVKFVRQIAAELGDLWPR